MTTIDLNADLGEGFGAWELTDDAALLEVVTSANVACGFHAGDPMRLRAVLGLAAVRGVAVGAQVSYRDLAGFGRRFLDASYDELVGDVLYQAGALQGLCAGLEVDVTYVKPHGALYHACSTHSLQGQAVSDAARALGLPVLAASGSPFLELSGGVAEAFVDRAYNHDGTLVSRSLPGAVVEDVAEVCARAVQLAESGTVASVTGALVSVPARSLCLHGDTPGAATMAAAVRSALEAAGVTVAAFT
ncbi:MAG: Lactam utilization protein LamB [Frankiales bacterium]|nr:Lactam utilization protein LamB [Frankiales bacterium]